MYATFVVIILEKLFSLLKFHSKNSLLKVPVILFFIFYGLLMLLKSESQSYKLGFGENIGIQLLCLPKFRKNVH